MLKKISYKVYLKHYTLLIFYNLPFLTMHRPNAFVSYLKQGVGTYCPKDNQPLKKGNLTVTAERGNDTDQYVLQKLKISYNKKVCFCVSMWNNNVIVKVSFCIFIFIKYDFSDIILHEFYDIYYNDIEAYAFLDCDLI